ncbi:unnamed protein product [Phaeothamnion confervicola]
MVRASRKRRIEVAGEEALETIVKDAEDSVLHAKPDEQLFVLDRRGSQRKRRRIEKGLVPGVRVARKSSKAEEKLIAKYAKKAGAGKSAAKPPGSDAPYDAWADGENDAIASVAAVSAGITVGAGPGAVTGTAGAAATRANGRLAGKGRRERKPAGLPVALKAPTAPLPGQSYNPTANDHQVRERDSRLLNFPISCEPILKLARRRKEYGCLYHQPLRCIRPSPHSV